MRSVPEAPGVSSPARAVTTSDNHSEDATHWPLAEKETLVPKSDLRILSQ